jgi:hypothetical protein
MHQTSPRLLDTSGQPEQSEGLQAAKLSEGYTSASEVQRARKKLAGSSCVPAGLPQIENERIASGKGGI